MVITSLAAEEGTPEESASETKEGSEAIMDVIEVAISEADLAKYYND